MAARLLFQRRFWPFFWVSFLTGFNDNVFKQALIVLVTVKSLTLGGLSTEVIQFLAPAVIILPFVLASATAGQVSDKWSKTTTIRGAKLAELPVMLIGSIGLVTENTTVMVTTLFLTGLQSTFFGPAKYSFLPEVLEPDELVGGNGLVETGTFLSVLLGTILGGVLVSLGTHGAWLAAGATIVIALLGIAAAFLIEPRPPADPTLKIDLNPVTPNVRILSATRHNEPVFLSIMGISWFWFFGAAFLSLVPAWVSEVAHADATVITLCTALFSIGIGIGSLWCERLSGGQLELGLVPFGSLGMSLFAIDLAIVGVPSVPAGLDWLGFLSTFDGVRASIDLAMVAMFGGFFTVPLYTMVQQRTDPTKRAQVIAGNNIINSVFIVAASLALLGLRAAGLSIPAIFATIALANLAVTAYIYHLIPEFMLRFCLWIVCSVMYRLRVVDGHRFPKEGRALVVANHVTYVDFLFLTAACRRPMRFVMYYTFVNTPILRWMFRDAKVIPIAARHENPELLDRAMDAIAAALENDELVCVFPEGMVTRDGKMTPFRPGIEKIVARTPAPVIPVAICNLWGSFFSYASGGPFRGAFRRIRSHIDVIVGETVPPNEVNAHDLALRVAALGHFEPPEPASPDNRPDAIVEKHERENDGQHRR